MNYLHDRIYLTPENLVEVIIDRQANVMLMTDVNHQNYRSGRRFSYLGGLFKESPVHLKVPHSDNWNLVIDLGGAAGIIGHSYRIL